MRKVLRDTIIELTAN